MYLIKRVEGGLNYERIFVCSFKWFVIVVICRIVMNKKCKVYKNKKKIRGYLFGRWLCLYIFFILKYLIIIVVKIIGFVYKLVFFCLNSISL